ncbi:SprT-like domain-containing protein [Streptomyces noursei]|uniref:SprT-like domain-containing protein n=1 Tax=Streptomyces noursei TaxID=1971 RepID=UPI0021A2EB17|nr:SprT-like domain-containing protein [Streptomyces noursei]UWS77557.1 SprT-like domain-containing protein [Streptomyces noursei]UWS77596.1 SprT-like domain-containing protein [Streptomyces noursei]
MDPQGRRPPQGPELFAGGELLALGGRRTMQTLLHEAAHAVAHVRRIADTSSDGRYHNRRFVAVAEELGLAGPAASVPVNGWNECTITDATAAKYAAAIEALDQAQLPYLHDPLALLIGGADPGTATAGEDGEDEDEDQDPQEGPVRPKKKRGNTRFLITCQCTEEGKDGELQPARRIQISRKAWMAGGEDGGLHCHACASPFTPAEPIDPDGEEDD